MQAQSLFFRYISLKIVSSQIGTTLRYRSSFSEMFCRGG